MHYAIVMTTHLGGLPADVEEPRGVFASEEDARQYLRETETEWAARGLRLPLDSIRIQVYESREAAQQADPADGDTVGRVGGRDIRTGNPPVRIISL